MTRDLKALVEKSKNDDKALLSVINYFEPKLKHCLYQTHPFHREELRQDLMIKLIQSIRKYDVDSVPGFWDMKKKYTETKNKEGKIKI